MLDAINVRDVGSKFFISCDRLRFSNGYVLFSPHLDGIVTQLVGASLIDTLSTKEIKCEITAFISTMEGTQDELQDITHFEANVLESKLSDSLLPPSRSLSCQIVGIWLSPSPIFARNSKC